MAEGTINVRLARTHGIYKEHSVDGAEVYDLHITGFDPVDGQPIRAENGEVLTPVYAVPRTDGVLAAIREKRLLDVRDEREVGRIVDAIKAARERRKADGGPRPALVAVPAEEPAPEPVTATEQSTGAPAGDPKGASEDTGKSK